MTVKELSQTSPQGVLPTPSQPTSHRTTASGTVWSQSKTLINFWLDVALMVLFMVLAWQLTILQTVFPRGAGPEWRLWGGTLYDWQDFTFCTFCVFAIGIVTHVMLHWNWICGTIATRLLRRKAGKDDGTQTLLGVGFLVALLHLLAAGVLWARLSLRHEG